MIAAAHVVVQGRELAGELAEEVAELGSIGDPVDQGQVLLQGRLPVDAVHPGVVKIIAQQPPGVAKHLPPLLPRIEGEGPAAQVQLAGAEIAERLGLGVDDVEIVPLADQELLAIR